MLMTGSAEIDAGRAFSRAARARRRALLGRVLRRRPAGAERLALYDERTARRRAGGVGPGVREIPIDAIDATFEPSRAALFDRRFRPAPAARTRWERIWLAEQRGQALPPISVVPVAGGYAVRDGHHRVSVARARGALTIDAVAEAL
jgi:hypothetical protein